MPVFSHASITLSYRTFGHGPSPLPAFHGFGRTGQDFSVFEGALGDRFALYAFDLPFHGDSPQPSDRALHPFEAVELSAFFAAPLPQGLRNTHVRSSEQRDPAATVHSERTTSKCSTGAGEGSPRS